MALDKPTRNRLLAIRNKMITDTAGALADLEKLLRRSADKVRREIIKALDLPPARQSARVRRLLESYHAADASLIAAATVDNQYLAATLADQYARTMAIAHADVLGVEAPGVTTENLRGLKVSDRGAAKLLKERTLGIGAPLPKPQTEGDKLAQENLTRFRGTGDISERLHGKATVNSREAARQVLRGIKETDTVANSAREMQRILRREGTRVAANDQLPRLLRDLEKAARSVSNRGSPADKRAWNQIIRRLNRYQAGLRETGTVRKAYLELLQTVQSTGFKHESIGRVIERWTYYKQRYRAEVWVRTETATAYRNLQLEQDKGTPWIIGYIWRMHRQTHKRWTKGRKVGRRVVRPGKRKKFGGKHCICEVLNGKRLSIETAKEFPNGGHPHCNCSLEPIFSRRKMRDTPFTDEELEFLDE
jgi:hypothetical protein